MRAAVPFVLFSAGSWRFAVEARRVRNSRPVPAATAAEAVETLVGLPPAADSSHPRLALTLALPDGEREVLVGGPVDLADIPAAELHPLPPLLAARLGLRGGKAIALPGGSRAILILEPAAWSYRSDRGSSQP